jgi:hypothetical protein
MKLLSVCLVIVGVVAFLNFTANNAVNNLKLSDKGKEVQAFRHALQVGKVSVMPALSRPHACQDWKTIEDIEREIVIVNAISARGLALRHVETGECISVWPGEKFIVTETGVQGFKIRQPDTYTDFWTPFVYEVP